MKTREVWSSNMMEEMQLIMHLLPRYPVVSLDTEFPGVLQKTPNANHNSTDPEEVYKILKLNVDATSIIQLGLTISNKHGELPLVGSEYCVWEFNFRDFNLERGDPHNPDSIQLLKRQGIDFQKNARQGIESAKFAECVRQCGLVCNHCFPVTWVGFQSSYDFGYLFKIVTQRQLPSQVGDFLTQVWIYFGPMVYDLKHMIKFCPGLYGGLDRVAHTLEVDRLVGKCHQAGSDSLLTMKTFMAVMKRFFGNAGAHEHRGVIHGLGKFRKPTTVVGAYAQTLPIQALIRDQRFSYAQSPAMQRFGYGQTLGYVSAPLHYRMITC